MIPVSVVLAIYFLVSIVVMLAQAHRIRTLKRHNKDLQELNQDYANALTSPAAHDVHVLSARAEIIDRRMSLED